MTIAAIAELKVINHAALDNAIIHSIPHKMMVERMKIEMTLNKRRIA